MLTPDQLDRLPQRILELYAEYENSVIQDIARRLAGLNYAKPSAAWQMQRLTESGRLYESILSELEILTGKSKAMLREMFEQAGVRALAFDDGIYEAAGLRPLPLNLSPAMAQVLQTGIQKTDGLLRNLTLTTAVSGQDAFIAASDLAYMQISSGAMSYQQAIRSAVKEMAAKGLETIQFASGRHDQLDVAVRRAVLTGVNQTVGQMQIARADEMGCDLVETTAHVGARNHGTGPANHEGWQGRIYSRSGQSRDYPAFIPATGYGTGPGLMGWNCRHNFYPYFEGISERAYSQATLSDYAGKTVTYNGEEMNFYDATQKQREIERKIRCWKRQAGALEAAGQENIVETAKVRDWQGRMRDFTRQTGLQRQREREWVPKRSEIQAVSLNLAKQRKLFSLYKPETNTISIAPIDLSQRYADERLKADKIVLTRRQKKHIRDNHPEDIDWLLSNQDLVVEAIRNPAYIDTQPRLIRRNLLTVAHVLPLTTDSYDFLTVVLSFHRNRPGPAEVWTAFRTRKDFLFENGELRNRWTQV